MIGPLNLKIIGAALICLGSCQKLKPESVAIPSYPDLSEMLGAQSQQLGSKRLVKEVSLGSDMEIDTFPMDSSRWRQELSFLIEINPNKPEYVGVFHHYESDSVVEMELKKGEKGLLKNLHIIKAGQLFETINATVHEDKDVYTHHQEIEVSFVGDLLIAYQIRGYQKMVLKDTVWFSLKGVITN